MAKQKRYSPEQITRILRQQEAGMKVAEICRQADICEQTFYRWNIKVRWYGYFGDSTIESSGR